MDDRISQKIENRGIKIARVNSIFITKSINLQLFTLILYGVEGPLWSKAISRVRSINREVYDVQYCPSHEFQWIKDDL